MAFLPSMQSEVHQWLTRFHGVGDSLDTSKLPTLYAKDVKLQFGNIPILQGLEAVTSFFEAIWPKMEMMHHEITGFDMVGNDKIYQQCRISFQVKDDPEKETIEIPAFAVYRLVTTGEERGLIKKFEAYLDASPLNAAIARASRL